MGRLTWHVVQRYGVQLVATAGRDIQLSRVPCISAKSAHHHCCRRARGGFLAATQGSGGGSLPGAARFRQRRCGSTVAVPTTLPTGYQQHFAPAGGQTLRGNVLRTAHRVMQADALLQCFDPSGAPLGDYCCTPGPPVAAGGRKLFGFLSSSRAQLAPAGAGVAGRLGLGAAAAAGAVRHPARCGCGAGGHTRRLCSHSHSSNDSGGSGILGLACGCSRGCCRVVSSCDCSVAGWRCRNSH